MDLLVFLPKYFKWHYSSAWKDLLRNCSQFLSFVITFFSLEFLLSTLFAPWRRIRENYEKGFDPEGFFSTFVVNSVMRFVGLVIRSVALIVGGIAVLLSLLITVFLFIFWAVFPLVILFLFAIGLAKIF